MSPFFCDRGGSPREKGLLLLDGLGRALAGAGAALNAQILVDLVVIRALSNGFVGAGRSSGAAGNAAVGNYVHRMYLLLGFECIVTYKNKNATGKIARSEFFSKIKEKQRKTAKKRACERYSFLRAGYWSGKVKVRNGGRTHGNE